MSASEVGDVATLAQEEDAVKRKKAKRKARRRRKKVMREVETEEEIVVESSGTSASGGEAISIDASGVEITITIRTTGKSTPSNEKVDRERR